MRILRPLLSVMNQIAIAIAWLIMLLLGALTVVIVATVMNIAFAISNWAGLGFLGFVILVVWMLFYAVKD